MTEGRLIVFEGIDGSGLTTQAHLLRDWYQREQRECHLTKEPSEGPTGAQIRLVLSKRLSLGGNESDFEHALALLFAADRMDHLVNLIIPSLSSGINVICDRYLLSSFAYQGISVDMESLRAMNRPCRVPDLTIFLDVPVEISQKRIARERWHVDLYEETEKLTQVRAKYLEVINQLRLEGHTIEVVNGNDTPTAVSKAVIQGVRKLYAKNGTSVATNQLSFDAVASTL